MGKLAGLLNDGIGLAMEASMANKSNRSPTRSQVYASDDQRQSKYESSSSRNITSGNGNYNNNDQQLSPPPNYEEYSCSSRVTEGTASTREGKNRTPLYETFQMDCSERVSSRDVSTVSDSTSTGQPFQFDLSPPQPGYSPYQLQSTLSRQTIVQGGLAKPVIIPQRRPGDKSRGWIPAYAPALQDCGIDQATFINFLVHFNEASKSSPLLDAVNVAGVGVSFVPGITPMIIGMATPAVVRVAKKKQTEQKSESFLSRANAEIFTPHGLFAMVLIFQPTDEQLNSTENVHPPIPESAPLVYLSEDKIPVLENNSSRRMAHFIADYGDRKAQAQYIQGNPSSGQALYPMPTFRSGWGDPTNPATNGSGGLRGLITGQVDTQRRGGKKQRKDKKGMKKELEERQKGDRGNKRPSLIGGVRGMISEGTGMKQNGSLIKSVKNMGMETNLLYLMITNNVTANDSTLLTSKTQEPRYTYSQYE